MKNFNKIFAAATASCLCFSSLTALSSNAMWTFGYPNEEAAFKEMLAKIDVPFRNGNITFDSENLVTYAWWVETPGIRHFENSYSYFSSNNYICTITSEPQVLTFTMDSPVSYVTEEGKETIVGFLNEIYPDVNFEVKSFGMGKFAIYDYDALPFDGRLDTIEEAERVYEFVSEHFPLKSCEFSGNQVSPMFGYINGYSYIYSYKGDTSYAEDTATVLQNYIDEKGFDVKVDEHLDCTHGIDYDYSKCYLEPTREMTSQEIAKLYTDIYHDLGLKPGYMYMEEDYVTQPLNLCKIDGDANNDSVLGIADATLILQFLTNKDEYDLTEQGAYNADLDKDGITANDALVIQQMLAERGEV